jgi:hypothetical protein
MRLLSLAALLLAAAANAEEPSAAPPITAEPPATGLPAAEPRALQQPVTEWRPAVYLLGTSERGSGAAYMPAPLDRLGRDDAANVALELDVRHARKAGKLEASAFVLAHDPVSAADRGFSLAARARATFPMGDSAWTFRAEDSARLQRRESVDVSDFQRNELWAEIARRTDGLTIGVRLSDRRRSVRHDPLQSFARQWLSASLSGGSRGDASWRLEAGPQYYSTDVAEGWRIATALEAAARVLGIQTALRLLWIEPLERGAGSGAQSPTTAPTPAPTPSPGLPTPSPEPSPVTVERPPVADTVAPGAVLQLSPPPPQLVGPALVVDPLDGDETDWDFGRRKQELRLVLAGRLPGALDASLELRAERERGPDLTVIGPDVDVRRDRFALRGSLRRSLGRQLALLAEGSWQRVRDNRPGFAYSRTVLAFGVELRP